MEVTQAMRDAFAEVAQLQINQWKDMPQEAKDKGKAMTREDRMSMHATMWAQADANGDEHLNEAEFVEYNKLQLAKTLETCGWAPEHNEEVSKACYQAAIAFTPNEKGLSQAGFMSYAVTTGTIRVESGF